MLYEKAVYRMKNLNTALKINDVPHRNPNDQT